MVLDLSSRRIAARSPLAGAPIGAASDDALSGLKVSHINVPLATAISDAKVLTGRQSPLAAIEILAVEAITLCATIVLDSKTVAYSRPSGRVQKGPLRDKILTGLST